MAHRLTEPFARGAPRDFGPWLFGDRPLGETIRRARRWLIAAGLLALLNGIVAVAVPAIASVAITLFVGWVLVAAAVIAGAYAISHRGVLGAVQALLTALAGSYLVIFPISGTISLTFVLAVWLCASGVLSLLAAARRRDAPDAALTALGGVVSVVLGVLVAVELPSSAAWAIGLLVGVNLIFWGLRALFGARALGRLLDEAGA